MLDQKGEKYRRALHRSVRYFGRGCDYLLMVITLGIVVSVLPAFAPELGVIPTLARLHDAMQILYTPLQRHLPGWLVSYNRTSIVFVVGLLILRNAVNWRIDRLSLNESRRREFTAREQAGAEAEDPDAAKRRQAASRRVAVSSYTEAKTILEAQKQDLTFVSLDIAGSTKMKEGEDPYVIEHAFLEYRKLVERIISRNNVYKAAWTPDGQMFAFKTPDDGIRAAQQVLVDLVKFNKEISKMKIPFRLRAGANCGIMSTDDASPMEQMSGEPIDVAGHMQKFSQPGDLWMSEQLATRLSDRVGIEPMAEKVDGYPVHVWKTPAIETAVA